MGLQFSIEEIVRSEIKGQISPGIWRRESAKDIAGGVKQGRILTANAQRKLIVIKGLQGTGL